MKDVAKFLFEIGMLSRTPRSGFYFLGTGKQSVAEHLLRTAYIGYALASMHKPMANVSKVVKMCLFHDVAEARVSDLNYVHQKYVERKEHEAIADLTASVPFGKDMKGLIDEYEERTSVEAILAKDADNIELVLSLKEQMDNGNVKAKSWMDAVVKRMKTDTGKELVKAILSTHSDDWWFHDKGGDWWITRGKK
jgi:putative hydrolases of HD superfamily